MGRTLLSPSLRFSLPSRHDTDPSAAEGRRRRSQPARVVPNAGDPRFSPIDPSGERVLHSGTMTDPAEVTPQGVAPAPDTAAADSVSKVLDDDNLLAEIIVRVGFPTSLVRAALVCRRWFRQASDPALLDRFRKLHPRRLLGFYLQHRRNLSVAAGFIPVLPQPPELGTVMRRKTYQYKCSMSQIIGCRNSSLLISVYGGDSTLAVHSPLCSDSERGLAILPPLPVPHFIFTRDSFAKLLSKEEGDGLSYFLFRGGAYQGCSRIHGARICVAEWRCCLARASYRGHRPAARSSAVGFKSCAHRQQNLYRVCPD